MHRTNNIFFLFIEYSTLNQYWNFIDIQLKMVIHKKNNRRYINVDRTNKKDAKLRLYIYIKYHYYAVLHWMIC